MVTPARPFAESETKPTERDALIVRIIELNPSATSEFLSQFDDVALHDYLEHLLWSRTPRGAARWGDDECGGFRSCA